MTRLLIIPHLPYYMLKRCTTSAGIFSQNGTMKTAGKAPEQYPECNEENSIDGGTTRPLAN